MKGVIAPKLVFYPLWCVQGLTVMTVMAPNRITEERMNPGDEIPST